MAKKRKSRTAEPTQPTESEQQQPEPTHEEQINNQSLQIEQQQQQDPNLKVEQEPIEESDEEEEEQQQEEENDDVMDDENKSDNQTNENHSNGVVEKPEEELEEEPLEKILEPFTKDQLTLLLKESVSKHPDLIENVHKLADADPAHRKIFVHGLGWEASSETITSVFGKYGEIEDCKVVKDKISGKSKGYGFILFKHRFGARRALKEPQKLIEGRMTSCQLASAGPVQAPPATVVANVSTAASEYTQRKIFVSNVSAEIEPSKLLEYFAQFGEIEEGPLGLDKGTGKFKGFCLFVYKSVESAKKALEEPHKNYEGATLHCQKAVDGPKHGKNERGHFPHYGGGGGYHQAKKGRFNVGHSGGGHLMAPSGGSNMPSMGFNPGVAPAAIGQAVAALLAGQGAGLGIGNLLGGMNQGGPQMMNNAGYGGPGGYGVQGGYGGQPQMGQPGVRPHQGGAPYMGHGR